MSRTAKQEADEVQRRKIATFLDSFRYEYRSLDDYASATNYFGRTFHVNHKIVEETSPWSTQSMEEYPHVILPFEFFSLRFDDPKPATVFEGEVPSTDQDHYQLTVSEITVARIFAEGDFGDGNLRSVTECVLKTNVDNHPFVMGFGIGVSKMPDGRVGAIPNTILGTSGVLNRHVSEDGNNSIAVQSYAQDCVGLLTTLTMHGLRIIVRFCELLNHRAVSAISLPDPARSRQERRRLTGILDVPMNDIEPPPPEYRIVIRPTSTFESIHQDIANHRHIRYTPKRRHEVSEHLRQYKPGKFTTVSSHQRGGGSGPGPDYLMARALILRQAGIDADASPNQEGT